MHFYELISSWIKSFASWDNSLHYTGKITRIGTPPPGVSLSLCAGIITVLLIIVIIANIMISIVKSNWRRLFWFTSIALLIFVPPIFTEYYLPALILLTACVAVGFAIVVRMTQASRVSTDRRLLEQYDCKDKNQIEKVLYSQIDSNRKYLTSELLCYFSIFVCFIGLIWGHCLDYSIGEAGIAIGLSIALAIAAVLVLLSNIRGNHIPFSEAVSKMTFHQKKKLLKCLEQKDNV